MGTGLAQAVQAGALGRVLLAVDVDQARASAAAEKLDASAETDVARALAREDIQAVLIASPPFLHRPLAEQAAAAGKHIFCEKPMGPTVADCDAIQAAADSAGVTLMIGQVLRFYPCWWNVLRLVEDGAIGKVIGMRVTRLSGRWGTNHPHWRLSLAQSGGALMEINAHEIDFMACLGGEPRRVFADGGRYVNDNIDYPDLAFVTVRFQEGAVGVLHSSICSPYGELTGTVQGTEGALHYPDGWNSNGVIKVAGADGKSREVRIGDTPIANPVKYEIDAFLTSVRDGTPPLVPGREGRRAVAIAEAAYRSIETGMPVDL
jgi:predicted dehydrogenase